MNTPEKVSSAWLIDCGGGVLVALGVPNVLHVVEDANLLFKVPLAPLHCNHALIWQTRVLPAVDLARLIASNIASTRKMYSCVLGWRDARGDTEYGVLLARSLPRRIVIGDEQSVDPDAANDERWRDLALGFFSYHKHTTPIIDPALLFDSAQNAGHFSESGRTHRMA